VSFEVDVTLVRETLGLTPTQRIEQNDRVLRMIEELRNGLAKFVELDAARRRQR
jgi:hypothetical protein